MILELKLLLVLVLALAVVRICAFVYAVRIYKRLKPDAKAWKTFDGPATEEFVESREYEALGDSRLRALCRILIFWQQFEKAVNVALGGVLIWIVVWSALGLVAQFV